MAPLEIILIVIIVLALFGGENGYSRRADPGVGPSGGLGLVVVILLVILLLRVIYEPRPRVPLGVISVVTAGVGTFALTIGGGRGVAPATRRPFISGGRA